ncbi:hypothetical protein GCM10025734_72300 [Kitasatospora paranensis]
MPAGRGVELHRVADQVLQQDAELGGVALDGRQRVVGDRRTGLLDLDAEAVLGGAQQRLQVDRRLSAVDAPDPGELQQVVDQRLHPVRAVHREGDVLPGPVVELLGVAALQQLAEAGDLAQRLLEVMGGHVGELFQLRVGPLEVGRLVGEQRPRVVGGGHLVDQAPAHGLHAGGQAAQVRRPALADLPVEDAAGHRVGVLGESAERRGHPAPQRLEDQGGERHDHGHDAAEDHVALHPDGLQGGPVDRPLVPQSVLEAGGGGPDGVEGAFGVGGVPFRLGDRCARRGGGHGPRGRPLPGVGGRGQRGEVRRRRVVTGQQAGQLGLALLLERESAGVRLQELGAPGEPVAADTGLLVDQGGLHAPGRDQRGGRPVDQAVVDRAGVDEDGPAEHAERGQHGEGAGDPDPQPPPGRPRGPSARWGGTGPGAVGRGGACRRGLCHAVCLPSSSAPGVAGGRLTPVCTADATLACGGGRLSCPAADQ